MFIKIKITITVNDIAKGTVSICDELSFLELNNFPEIYFLLNKFPNFYFKGACLIST